VELGDGAERLRELVAAAERVQERGVHRVHAVVLHLEPVARQHELRGRHQLVAGHVVAVVHRKRGAPAGRTEVGEHEARELARGIGALPDALPETAARRLARRLETAAVDVVHPAVVAAAKTALERDPELQRRPTMRAVQVQHADAAAAVAEHYEILTQEADPQRRRGEIAHKRHRLPEAAQILTARRSGTDLGQFGIWRWDFAAAIAIERTGLRLCGARSSSLHGIPSLAPTSERSQATHDAEQTRSPLVDQGAAASTTERSSGSNYQWR